MGPILWASFCSNEGLGWDFESSCEWGEMGRGQWHGEWCSWISAWGEWAGDSWHEALLYAVFLVLTELRQQVSPSSEDQMPSYAALKPPCSSGPQRIQVTRPMDLGRRQTCCFYLHLGLANCLNFLYNLSIFYFQAYTSSFMCELGKLKASWSP